MGLYRERGVIARSIARSIRRRLAARVLYTIYTCVYIYICVCVCTRNLSPEHRKLSGEISRAAVVAPTGPCGAVFRYFLTRARLLSLMASSVSHGKLETSAFISGLDKRDWMAYIQTRDSAYDRSASPYLVIARVLLAEVFIVGPARFARGCRERKTRSACESIVIIDSAKVGLINRIGNI